jgi:hypothetical protein
MKLTAHLYLVPKSRMVELYLHSPLCLHGRVLNKLSTGTTLPFTFTLLLFTLSYTQYTYIWGSIVVVKNDQILADLHVSSLLVTKKWQFFNVYSVENQQSFHVRWVPCHHGMARPQVADGEDGLQIWRVDPNTLNKQSRTADKGWASSVGTGRGANNSSP